jgi:hypothetical protein
MAAKLERIPGMTFNFTQPMAMRMDEVISGVKADVAVKVFGEDADQLERIAERVRAALKTVPGVADLQMELASGVGELRVEPDRLALARYGLTIADLAEYVDSATGGRQVSEFIEGQRRFPLVVRLPQRFRTNPDLLKALVIRAPTGGQVRLDQIAHVSTARGPEIVSRENGQRRIVVQSNVRGRDLGSFIQAAREAIAKSVTLPSGYWLDWGAQFKSGNRHQTPDDSAARLCVRHLLPALCDVPDGAASAADLLRCAVCPHRRHRGAVAARIEFESLSQHRLHRAIRRGGVKRNRDGDDDQPVAHRRPGCPSRRPRGPRCTRPVR